MVGDTSLLLRVAAPRASATAAAAAAAALPSGGVLLWVLSGHARLRFLLRYLYTWVMLVARARGVVVRATRERCPDRSSATTRRFRAGCQPCGTAGTTAGHGWDHCFVAEPALPRCACPALAPPRDALPNAGRLAASQARSWRLTGILACWHVGQWCWPPCPAVGSV